MILKNKNTDKVLKIEVKDKELYEFILSESRNNKYETYEQDLITEHQYLIENEVKISNLSKKTNILKYLCLDIETIREGEEDIIIMISTYSPDNSKSNKVFVNAQEIDEKHLKSIEKTKFEGFKVELLENEAEILEKFKNEVVVFEPQVMIGWNVIDFDFRVIKERMKLYSIDFKFSKYGQESKLKINKDFFKDSTMVCSGILVWDAIQILKSNFIAFEDYKLDTVAKEALKDEKIDLNDENADNDDDDDKLEQIRKLLNSNPIKLIEYNFKDSVLVSKIVEKLKLFDLMTQRSIITNTPLQKVKSPIATLDIMYLKELHKKGFVAPSNFNYTTSSPIEGAYVVSPVQGFYDDVYVLDFKSLYPSIIMTFNIDPFTYDENGQIEAPNGAKFIKNKGVLPELILRLYKERDIAKKEKDEVKSFALKTTMNSFYGAVASPKSRLYNKDVGEAITSFARFIIKKAKKFVEDRGDQVIYGDTDSIFVKLSGKLGLLDEKISTGRDLEKDLNEYFKKWVEEEFGQENFLNIEFEKFYSNFFIASKKRYVGFDEFKKDYDYVGIEAIRGDWTNLAKKFQISLIDKIFSKVSNEDIKKFILEEVDKLKKGEYDEDLVYKKKTTKPLYQYTKMTPPHVKAARELPKFNKRLVEYIMTKNGPKHIKLIDEKTQYDYEHYVEKQLKGVSDDLLENLDIDFDEVVKSKSQKSLNRFF
jgi:DNA polymerase-2